MKNPTNKLLSALIVIAIAFTASATASSTKPIEYFTDWEKRTPTPFITTETKFIKKKVNFDNMPMVSEGIFYLMEYNRSIGYASYFGFWTVDGKRLFPAQYEQFRERPRFDSGACVVKNANPKNRHGIILYADGTTRELSKEWVEVTQFYDGVAMVRESAGMRSSNLFYINTKGEKIWKHLAENNASTSIHVSMRPLKEELRAYFSNAKGLWGFIDTNGKVVIPPKFREVRDFSGGYALAFLPKSSTSNIPVFIDKTGKTVVEVPSSAPSLLYAAQITDIANGYFAISDNNGAPTTFYDLDGKAVKTYEGGASGFSDGTASVKFQQYGWEDPTYIIDDRFDIVGKWKFIASEFTVQKPTFEISPYFTYDNRIAINHLGQPVMYVPGNKFSGNSLGQFSPDGYAKASSVFKDDTTGEEYNYIGYVDLTGRYTVVFCDKDGDGPFVGLLPGPQPIKPRDLEPRLPSGDTIPAGPTTTIKVLYDVKATAYPKAGGTVYGSGKYSYGDTVRVTGTPTNGWKLSAINVNNPSAITSTFNKFVVKGNLEITCHFTKEDTVTSVETGCFSGQLHSPIFKESSISNVEVYLQLGDKTGSEYTNNSQGFLAVLFDTEFSGNGQTATGDDVSTSGNVFFVPMNVLGQIEESGKRWLLLDGGIIKYANVSVTDNSAQGVLNNPLIKLMMMFDNADSGELRAGHYRVDITGSDIENGTVRFGTMQRFSSEYGWLPAGDEIFEQSQGGFFIKRVDKGLNAEFLDGAMLSRCQRKTVPFYPPEGFDKKEDDSALGSFARRLGEMYRGLGKVDKRFSDYDLQQFSTDLDNNLFKIK